MRNSIQTSLLFVAMFLGASLFALACNDQSVDSNIDSFNRRAMLENVADNILLPSLGELQGKVNVLKEEIDVFIQSPSEGSLQNARAAWEAAYLSWQYCSGFNFGPAQTASGTLFQKVGVFPASAARIEGLITEQNFSSDLLRDTRGFNSVEYLLFDGTSAGEIVSKFSNANRKSYLQIITNDIKVTIDAVCAGWTTYRQEFVTNTGTDIGSSTTVLFNEFVFNFESIKNFKVGVPLGKRPGQNQPEPARVEAYYSGKSLTFMKEHLKAITNLYYGIGRDGIDRIGYVEYLQSLPGGSDLIAQTESQLQVVQLKLNAIPSSQPFAQSISSHFAEVDALHTELQRHTRFFKSEMASLLSLTITFSSGDGD